jgi:hypothetical protein
MNTSRKMNFVVDTSVWFFLFSSESLRRSAPSKLLDPPKVKIIVAQIVEALV